MRDINIRLMAEVFYAMMPIGRVWETFVLEFSFDETRLIEIHTAHNCTEVHLESYNLLQLLVFK